MRGREWEGEGGTKALLKSHFNDTFAQVRELNCRKRRKSFREYLTGESDHDHQTARRMLLRTKLYLQFNGDSELGKDKTARRSGASAATEAEALRYFTGAAVERHCSHLVKGGDGGGFGELLQLRCLSSCVVIKQLQCIVLELQFPLPKMFSGKQHLPSTAATIVFGTNKLSK